MKKGIIAGLILIAVVVSAVGLYFFSEERQNKISRSLSTTLGLSDGCVEIYASQATPVKRFLKVEKLSTAYGTDDAQARPYRYGYGYIDTNSNGTVDTNEKGKGKAYFEVGDYSQYIYTECKGK